MAIWIKQHGKDVSMGQHHALGFTGRTGGVDQGGKIIGADPGTGGL